MKEPIHPFMPHDTDSSRRDFLGALATTGAALAAAACAPAAQGAKPATPTPAAAPAAAAQSARPGRSGPQIPIPPTTQDGPWDHSWLERVKHATAAMMFDIGAYQNGGGLYYAKNWLNGMRDGWSLESPDVVALLGISGDAYPIVFNDAMWEKYKYGESSKTTDVRTEATAVRNVWWQPKAGEPMIEFGVDVLQTRGAQLLLCNNVFRGVIRRAMAATSRPYAEVRAELKANMLPGVVVVPAMVAAMGMAQKNGAAYVYAGS
jgi:hypothetical protein